MHHKAFSGMAPLELAVIAAFRGCARAGGIEERRKRVEKMEERKETLSIRRTRLPHNIDEFNHAEIITVWFEGKIYTKK